MPSVIISSPYTNANDLVAALPNAKSLRLRPGMAAEVKIPEGGTVSVTADTVAFQVHNHVSLTGGSVCDICSAPMPPQARSTAQVVDATVAAVEFKP